MKTTVIGYREYVSIDDARKELGIAQWQFDELMEELNLQNDITYDFGIQHISLETFKQLEAEYLKTRHKSATMRQAIGLIALWDCDPGMDEARKIAKKWSDRIQCAISPKDISFLVTRFVNMREKEHWTLTRPNDEQFAKAAEIWSIYLGTTIFKEDVEYMLGVFVEGKDFFEERKIA